MNRGVPSAMLIAAFVMPGLAVGETTLYGRLDNRLDYIDTDDADKQWDVNTGTTRIGVKGSEDLGEGMKAVFHAEWAFNSTEGGSTADGLRNRLAYAGLTGGYGSVAIGRQWTPYKGSIYVNDVYNNSANTDSHYLGTTRTGNALVYASPQFDGLQAKLMMIVDGGDDAADFADAWNGSIEYDNAGLHIGIGFHSAENDYDLFGIGASYESSGFKFMAQYERLDPDSGGDQWEAMLGAEMYLGNNTLRATYGRYDWDIGSRGMWSVGYQYNFSNRTRVYAEYGDQTDVDLALDDEAQTAVYVLSIGLRHYF